jgi:hypothetical protein
MINSTRLALNGKYENQNGLGMGGIKIFPLALFGNLKNG